MRVDFGNHWKVMFVLSIILPMTFGLAFKFSGISGVVAVGERMTLETVEWKRERPSGLSDIPNSPLEVNHRDVELSFSEVLKTGDYDPDWFGFGPCAYFGIMNLTVSVEQGFVEGVNLNLTEGYSSSRAILYYSEAGNYSSAIQGSGLRLDKIIDGLKNSVELAENSKLYLRTIRTGEDRVVTIAQVAVLYEFRSPQNYTHQIDIVGEIVYFNGTIYKSVIQPVRFVFGPDGNDSPQSAEQLEPDGISREFYIGHEDVRDFYKVYMTEGERIEVMENGTSIYCLYLFAPSEPFTPVANSTDPVGTDNRFIQHTITASGWWYVLVDSNGGKGLYALIVARI